MLPSCSPFQLGWKYIFFVVLLSRLHSISHLFSFPFSFSQKRFILWFLSSLAIAIPLELPQSRREISSFDHHVRALQVIFDSSNYQKWDCVHSTYSNQWLYDCGYFASRIWITPFSTVYVFKIIKDSITSFCTRVQKQSEQSTAHKFLIGSKFVHYLNVSSEIRFLILMPLFSGSTNVSVPQADLYFTHVSLACRQMQTSCLNLLYDHPSSKDHARMYLAKSMNFCYHPEKIAIACKTGHQRSLFPILGQPVEHKIEV